MVLGKGTIGVLAVAITLALAGIAQAADTGTITGRVLDKDGTPAKGAAVKVVSANRVPPSQRKNGGPAALATATTGDDGTFSVDVAAGSVRVVATSGSSQGVTAEPVGVVAGKETKVGDIKLK